MAAEGDEVKSMAEGFGSDEKNVFMYSRTLVKGTISK
jgi:hypothetical protein